MHRVLSFAWRREEHYLSPPRQYTHRHISINYYVRWKKIMDRWTETSTCNLANRDLSPCKRDAAGYVNEHRFSRTCAAVSWNISISYFDPSVTCYVTRKHGTKNTHAFTFRILRWDRESRPYTNDLSFRDFSRNYASQKMSIKNWIGLFYVTCKSEVWSILLLQKIIGSSRQLDGNVNQCIRRKLTIR